MSGQYATPTNGDVLQFDGTKQTNSTDNMSGLNYVAALIVNANYGGEIDLNYSLTVGTADDTTASGVASGLGGGKIFISTNRTLDVFSGATFNATGGTIYALTAGSATFQVEASANLNFTGTGTILETLTLTNNGSVDLKTTGDLHINNVVINNTGGAAGFIFEGGQSLHEDGTGSTFNNDAAGVLLKLGAGTTSTIPCTFENGGGTVDLDQGTTLKITGAASQGGGITHLANGSNFWTTNGYTVNGGTVSTGGPGSSTIIGNLDVIAGTVSPGQDGTLGTLDITGNCTLGVNSELDIDVDVANGAVLGNDQLVLNTAGGGALTLQGGTLNVNTISADGTSPANGLTISIIQFLSVSGDFGPTKSNTGYGAGFWGHKETGSAYQLIANTF